jgi:hypothetical protein
MIFDKSMREDFERNPTEWSPYLVRNDNSENVKKQRIRMDVGNPILNNHPVYAPANGDFAKRVSERGFERNVIYARSLIRNVLDGNGIENAGAYADSLEYKEMMRIQRLIIGNSKRMTSLNQLNRKEIETDVKYDSRKNSGVVQKGLFD